jgi:predicted nuclease with TOPRIM domain
VLDGFGGARARLIEELNGTITSLEHANLATRQLVEAELVELRGDLADALEEVRERVEGAVNEASESIAATVEEHHAASEELRDGIHTAAQHSQESAKRIRGLHDTVSRLDSTLAELQGDWRPRVDAVVAEGRASAQSVLEEVQAEIDRALSEMTETLAAQVKTVRSVTGSLGGSSERLISAGQALLAYLGERDRWLERERDRVLHELLDEFAEGLSAKERSALASRVGEALDRRRDARDAARYRRSPEARVEVEIPPIPAELAELDKPVVPVMPSRRPRPAATAESPPAPEKPAKRTSKSTSSATPRKTSTARTSRASSTAKTPSKSTKKATSKAAPRKRTTSE